MEVAKMGKNNCLVSVGVVVLLLFLLFGCGSNIQHIPTAIDKPEGKKIFNNSFEDVWTASIRSLSEEETLKVTDKAAGIIVTEFRTIDAKELSILETTFLGKTYKGSYTLNFDKISNAKTELIINVKLQAVQVGFFSREEKLENVENYLRQKLFDKISSKLGEKG